MLMKICKCGRRIKQGEICECQKQRHKRYNENVRDEEKNNFYHSRKWRQVSNAVKERANGLDEYALIYEKRMVKGSIAHHIYEISECEELRFSLENLIYVSSQTHNKIHAEYAKGVTTKNAMQEKLIVIREKKR